MRPIVLLAVLSLVAAPVRAEDEPDLPPPSDEDEEEEEPPSDPDVDPQLQQLRDEIELLRLRLDAVESTPPVAPPPARSAPNVFNPRITGFIDLAAGLMLADQDVTPGFDIRSFELDFRADIDPFAKAVVVLGFENPLLHAVEEAGSDADDSHDGAEEAAEAWLSVVEEANVTFVALPAHLLLELGLVRVDFGSVNRAHRHDLPHFDYPGATAGLLGEEGWSDAGATLRYRLHNPRSAAVDFKVGVMARGPEPLMEDREKPTPVLLGRFTASGDPGPGSLVDGGASYVFWSDAAAEARGFHLASVDLLFKARPPSRGRYRSLFAQGEVYFANRFGDGGRNSLGGMLGLGFQPARNVFVALRGDALLDDLSAPADVTWGAGIAASLYTSEFLRFRLAYDVADDETITHRFGLQVTAVFGSHPVEPYWVNR